MLSYFNNYPIDEIKKIIDGEFLCHASDYCTINHLLIDSRTLTMPENTLFFALKSKRNNGHKYINELIEKGVKNFIVSEPFEASDVNVILVKDCLKALQKLCQWHRKKFNIPVVAITGSNGKTIIKEWLFQLLAQDKTVVRSPKSYNSQIGVPLSVWQLSDNAELGIFEAGISEPNEMEALKNIILPDYGIFTNIGAAHDENFINRNQKIGEKLKLFTNVKTLIYCSDYSEIQEVIIKSQILKKIKSFTWSRKNDADLFVMKIRKNERDTVITIRYQKNDFYIQIPFNDDASIENAIHCCCLMLLLGYSIDVITERLTKLTPVAMRLELKEGINNCTIINDTYNSDINSLIIALDFLKHQRQHNKRTIILSDILQSGRNDNELYEEVSNLLNEKGINKIIGIGKSISTQAKLFNIEKVFYPNTDSFINNFTFGDLHNEAILLKGARDFEFEKIIAFLQQKTHKTTLEINLNAIVHNLNYYKSQLKSGVKIMAMVKAFSYGTGSFEIANVLQYNQVDYLGVAFTDEGKELRKAGITLPVMVMNPEELSFDDMIKYNLEPEIFSFRILDLFVQTLGKHNLNEPYPIHIKLDTGMRRLGFEEHQVNELLEKLKICKNLKVKSVFSHLASSNNPLHDDFTKNQIEIYERICTKLKKDIEYPFDMHILNTAGISRFVNQQYNMVRLGLGLYGVSSINNEQEHLLNVSVLRTSISQIKNIKKNESIGYDRNFIAEQDMKIATVPVGYADGLNRILGNGKGKMKINGAYVPIIGNICMDMCMLDVSHVEAQEGDEVIVFDKDYTIVNFAEDMNTIPYEVFTSFSRRVKRVYFHE